MNLLKRVLVAFVFVPIILLALIKGDIYLTSFLSVVGVVGFWELNRLFKFSFTNNFIFSLFLFLVIFSNKIGINIYSIFGIILPFLMLFSLIFNRKSDDYNKFSKDLFIVIGGLFYLILPIVVTIKAYETFDYRYGIFLFGNIWLNDTFAYFVGMLIGKHKFAKLLSPKKSLEGFFGGMLFAMIFSLWFVNYFNFLNIKLAIVSSIAISIFGPFGDLFESAIKRKFGIKDSSNIIPGHGGVLDRFDSFFMAAPVLYFIVFEIGKIL